MNFSCKTPAPEWAQPYYLKWVSLNEERFFVDAILTNEYEVVLCLTSFEDALIEYQTGEVQLAQFERIVDATQLTIISVPIELVNWTSKQVTHAEEYDSSHNQAT